MGTLATDVDLAASKAPRSLMPRKEEQVFSLTQSAFLRLFYRLLDFPRAYTCKPLDLRLQGVRISPPMPSKKPEREFRVGEKVRVNLHVGKISEATIRAIIPQTDGLRLQVDFGFEQTALIHMWQVVDD
jgi:transcription antitermination factor NusG